ncbi:tbg-1 [Pristionchus pacificus]|nr:tbg-1 [Pristionchus pacificus]
MSNAIISLHVGQCGNQIGHTFWKTLVEEHGLNVDGTAKDENSHSIVDGKHVFFNQADDDHYVPRSILVDLEPRVINGILSSEYSRLFSKENVFLSETGGGAGNNWASGFMQGNEVFESIIDMVDREAELAPALDGFNFTHSVSGGTGSGLGSRLLEKLRDRYPKTIIQSYSVFSDQDAPDVVVQPYNSILTLQRLMECTNSVVVLDNTALNRVVADRLGLPQASFEHVNKLVARIMSATTATIRFPSALYTRLQHLVCMLVPFPPLRFIQTAFSPIADPKREFVSKTTVKDIMRTIMQPSSMMVSTRSSRSGLDKSCLLQAVAMLQGEFDDRDIPAAYEFIHERRLIKQPPWAMASPLHIHKAPLSPFIKPTYKVSGMLMANHTNVASLFADTLAKYEKFRSKRAFLDRFEREEGFSIDLMQEAADKTKDLLDLYKEINSEAFFGRV